MGQVSTEQVVAIIDAVQPEAAVSSEPNYWWLMLIAVVPVVLAPFVATWFQKRKLK